ncbi:hypothetical protein [Methanoculleus sp.]|uniref:hypothetical protein n=1 Tax=Methanoculleus sp. TaxID=90427 RepID=UPI001BD503BD|nr:hypothetical protein [Methanoculleus sp.]
MPLISEISIRYAAQGWQSVLDAERRVRSAISETARRAARDEGVTKRWMERHKTALLGIGVAASGAMAAIVAGSPSLQAALDESRLWFSMFAEEMGATWSPALEWFNGLLEDAYDAYEKLPEPLKSVFAWGLFVSLGILAISGAVAGLSFLLGPLIEGDAVRVREIRAWQGSRFSSGR